MGGRPPRPACGCHPRTPRPPLSRPGCHDAGWDQIRRIHGFIGISIWDSHSSAVRQPATRPGRNNRGVGTKGGQVDGASLLLIESKWKLLKELFSPSLLLFLFASSERSSSSSSESSSGAFRGPPAQTISLSPATPSPGSRGTGNFPLTRGSFGNR